MDLIGIAGWALLIFFVAIPLLTLWVYAVVDMFRRPDLATGRVVAWFIALVMLPVVASVYYLLRRRIEERPQIIGQVASRLVPRYRAADLPEKRRILEVLRAAGLIEANEFDDELRTLDAWDSWGAAGPGKAKRSGD